MLPRTQRAVPEPKPSRTQQCGLESRTTPLMIVRYEITTANNAMLARFSAHHEPFYRALRAHRIAIS